jgi:hypothetical protein
MSYFDTINKFNQESNDKFENTSRLMSVAIEDKANSLREIHQNLVDKYETGSIALSGLSGAWMGARKVAKKLASSKATKKTEEPKEDDTEEAEDPAEAVDDSPKIEDLDGDTEVGEVAPDILTAEGAAPISANAAAFGGEGATAASGAETAGGAAAGTEAGGAAAAGEGAGAAAAGTEGAAAAGTTVATTAGTTVAETTGATLGGATGEAAASTALDFLGPVGMAAGAVLGLVDLFKGIFDKTPTAEDLAKQAPIVSGGGSIDAGSIVKAAPVTQTLV